MLRKFLDYFRNNRPINFKKQTTSQKLAQWEVDAICQQGVIGLEEVWGLYDMWI
ncbi:MAG: hypothetical protein N5P05_001212 [Chroococcopsis gigantea SAG 12.99]|nr:hypothetical protein [Chlorogloea purpurea SAG 13.99]MDV2999606.1 hypothetical protein [Chroococcopsis gigantea SAG 12.99]